MGGSTFGAPSTEQLQQIAIRTVDEVVVRDLRDLSTYDIVQVGGLAVTGGNLELAERLAQHLFTTALTSNDAPYNLECAKGYQTLQRRLDAVQE